MKVINTISSGMWYEYLENQFDWKSIRKDNPIEGLRFRNKSSYGDFYCVASGVNSYAENEYCGGINQICRYSKGDIYKIDNYPVRQKINSSEFEILLNHKRNYPDLHHIKAKELFDVFPILDKSK